MKFLLLLACCHFFLASSAQMITGVWKGKSDKKKLELKLIQNGDSLTGTAYYYESANVYKRYSVRGYFDALDNSVVWWDDQLIEEKGNFFLAKPKGPQLSVADFNCPGGGKMFLNGKTQKKENPAEEGKLDLTKVDAPSFRDEWDYVIDNYTVGTNDPEFIDSVARIAFTDHPKPIKSEEPIIVKTPSPEKDSERHPEPVTEQKVVVNDVLPTPTKPLTIEEKFVVRKKVYTTEIPVSGDSVELRFYDNAEVDGDSISLFLNGKMLFTHVRLSYKAHVVKLATKELTDSSELVMVAENLGSIPPNTSSMVALVGDKRYEANLSSTENTSAVIRLRRQRPEISSR